LYLSKKIRMKNCFIIVACVLFVFSCKKNDKVNSRKVAKVWIKNIIEDSTLNIRAFEEIDGNIYYASGNGENGVLMNDGTTVKGLVHNDTMSTAFRSMAFNGTSLFFLSIESPALVYKLDYHKKNKAYLFHRLVYQENHKKAFYDSMNFWNEQEGIAIGDPTDDCMSIIITRDGGNTWKKISCNDLPKAKEGEAAFAASDTNIAIVGDKVWVATGGKASRILYSPDKGHTWQVFETPIIQGKETTGMYSLDFYDELNGFAIGGDYTKPDENTANKIRTLDGGKTWQIVAKGQNPGYRSCVQYIPNRKGEELVAVGFKGIDYSNDSGNSWKHLSDEGFYTIRFLNDSVAYAAGKGRISKLTFRE
jgi:photosystem II stability/assembly factor-like uncharacterized protein